MYGRSWDKSNNCLNFDKDAILEGFYVMGKGIVKSVQVKENNSFVLVPH